LLVESLERLLARLGDDDRVLDVGGWAAPLNRADWVIDLMPYATRGALPVGSFGPGPERFSADTWVQRDICAREPYPFEDGFFDFAVCTYTLEDIRDPIWVCEEMSRVAKAGLIEVPSLVDELSWNVPAFSGGRWVGHDHHRWLCFTAPNSIEFMHKPHSLHAEWRATVPARRAAQLRPDQRVQVLWWEGDLAARERVVIGAFPLDELEQHLHRELQPSRAELRLREARARAPGVARSTGARARALAGRLGRAVRN
jgi:hypothetical protein